MATLQIDNDNVERMISILSDGHRITFNSFLKANNFKDIAEDRDVNCYLLEGAGRYIVVAE